MNAETKRAAFDELALRWDEMKPRQLPSEGIERGLDLLGSLAGLTVVDLGCGTGRLEDLLLRRIGGGSIFAVDFSAGMIALRPETDGRITGYDGFDKVQQAFGKWILDYYLPAPGTATQSVAGGYMANAWIRMQHPDYDELRRMLNAVGETVKVRARG